MPLDKGGIHEVNEESMKIGSSSLTNQLFGRYFPGGYSSNRNDDVVILLHRRKMNQIENPDQVIVGDLIA